MRKFTAWLLVVALAFSLCICASAAPAKTLITTTPTGYDSADDVVYKTYSQSGKTVIANWGARGETCTFLSSYAEDYYTGSYIWDTMSDLSGGTSTSNTPSSALYKELKELMEGTHSFYTYYDGNKNVRNYYCYTDCVSNDISKVSLIYQGGLVTSEWNSGTIWNQEHCWPQSKLNNSKQIGDIMHLRPANPRENSSRGNTAYGESSGYYDPGVSVRGDCARMVLYMYVRWGVTGTMWGESGVIESVDVLLKWMEEDPVDTWEMGRNDSVESITGVRNVFVDYPEYAWLLFGEDIPADLETPSGEATEGGTTACTHAHTQVRNAKNATCGATGYTGDTYCTDCGKLVKQGTTTPATGEHNLDATGHCTNCNYYEAPTCTHQNTDIRNAKDATCGQNGYSGDTYCANCGKLLKQGSTIPATGEHNLDETGHCTGCDYYEVPTCTHADTEVRNAQDATCGTEGYSGDTYCRNCNVLISEGAVIPATGEHSLDQTGHCTNCDFYDSAACVHANTEVKGQWDATCVTSGHTGDTCCSDCGTVLTKGEKIPATGEHHYDESGKCTGCGNKQPEVPVKTTFWDSLVAFIVGLWESFLAFLQNLFS